MPIDHEVQVSKNENNRFIIIFIIVYSCGVFEH